MIFSCSIALIVLFIYVTPIKGYPWRTYEDSESPQSATVQPSQKSAFLRGTMHQREEVSFQPAVTHRSSSKSSHTSSSSSPSSKSAAPRQIAKSVPPEERKKAIESFIENKRTSPEALAKDVGVPLIKIKRILDGSESGGAAYNKTVRYMKRSAE